MAVSFWRIVADNMPDWQLAKQRKISGYELRQKYIHTHGVVLQALGNMGANLTIEFPESWQKKLSALQNIDWSRSNMALWEGRAMLGGKVNKARQNVILTTIALKQVLDVPLTDKEKQTESQFQGHGK